MGLAKIVPGGEIPVFLAAVLSHFALDAVPHGDVGIGHWVGRSPDRIQKVARLLSLALADQLTALAVFGCLSASPAFAQVPFPLLAAGAIGSMLPDYLTGFRDLLFPSHHGWLQRIHRIHERCHFRGRDPFSTAGGLIFQTLLVLAGLFLAWHR